MTEAQHDDLRFAVLGPGRLGSTLARALVSCGRRVSAIAGGGGDAAAALAGELPDARRCAPAELAQLADVIFVTVPDRQILRACGPLALGKDHALLHCSGAVELSDLSDLSATGAALGCFHPLQSFPTTALDHDRFKGITIGIEAPEPWAALLHALCDSLGADALPLSGVDRASYHAAAVLASNAVVGLHSAAADAWALAGLAPASARRALAPLTAGAAEAIARLPLREALTGPVARGDVATVRAHLRALSPRPQLSELYRDLSRRLLALGLPEDAERRSRLATLLGQATAPGGEVPEQPEDAPFMQRAIEEAGRAAEGGDVPVGCVLVRDGQVIATGRNLREQNADPTAHAEVVALREASQKLGRWRLSDVTAYVTLEPCPMCAGALVHSRVQRVVYGCDDPKAGALRSLYQLGDDARLNHRLDITAGVLGDACAAQLSGFFADIRGTGEGPADR